MNRDDTHRDEHLFPLAMASEGERVQISILHGGGELETRLASLGLNTGCELEVLHRLSGNIVVRRGESRLALGAGMAQKVMVVST